MGPIKIIESGLLWWVGGVFRRPRLSLAATTLLAVIGLALASTDLEVNTDASDMIDSSLPYRVAQRDFEAAFPDLDDIILVLVRARSADEADGFATALTRNVETRKDQIRTVYAPETHPYFARNGLLLMAEDDLNEQLNQLTKAAPVIDAINQDRSADSLFNTLGGRAALARDANSDEIDASFLKPVYKELAEVIDARLDGTPRPLSWARLFAVDEDPDKVHQRVVAVSPELDFSSLQPAKQVIAVIRETLDALEGTGEWDGVEVGITGTPALRTEELRSVSNGIGLSMGLSFLAVAILLWLALRSVGMVLSALSTLVLTLAITAGIATLTVGALNLVSVAFAVLLIGLGIDFAIHLALHILETRRSGSSADHSVESTVHEVGGALALCAPTTALAFFAFVPTQFVGMAQLGIISGAGVLVAFMVAITVIPATVALLPHGLGGIGAGAGAHLEDVTKGTRGRIIAGVTVLIAVLSLPLMTQVRFNADPMDLRDPTSPSVQTFQKLFDDSRTSPYRLDVLAATNEEAEALATRLDALPEVGRTITLADFVPEDQDIKLELIDFAGTSLQFALRPASDPSRNAAAPLDTPPHAGLEKLRAELAAGEASPEADQLMAALDKYGRMIKADGGITARLESDLFRFWDFQMDRLRAQLAPSPVSVEDLPVVITDRFRARDGRYRLEIMPEESLDVSDEAMRRQFVESVATIAPQATGSALTVLRAGEIVAGAMIQATLTAGIIVFVLLLALLRNVVMVLMILLPVALAAILTAATGVLLDQPFNFANVIVIPLLIGLGADSGIHLAMRSSQFVRHSTVFTTTTPRAVLFSALTTIASFGTLALSDHQGTASMGALLTISIAFTLLCSLLVLPVALDLVGRRPAAS